MGDPTGLSSIIAGKVFDTAIDYVKTANQYNARHKELEDLVTTTGAFLQACPSRIDRRIVQRVFEDVQPLHKGAQQLMRKRQAWEHNTTTIDRHLRLHTRYKLSKDALDHTQKIRTTEADGLPRAILVTVLDLQKELKALRKDVRDIKSSLGHSGAGKQATFGQETETPQEEERKPKKNKQKKRKPKTSKLERDGEAAGTGMDSARADCVTSFAHGVRSIQERFIEAIKEGGREAFFDIVDGAMQQVVNLHLESIRSAQISQRWPSSSVTCGSSDSTITVANVHQVQDGIANVHQVQDGIELTNVVLPESRESEDFESEEMELADIVDLVEEGHKTQMVEARVEVECREQLYGPASSQDISREISYGKTGNFTLRELTIATNDFAHEIGAGGYGQVYMGFLPDGSRIAVKVSSNGDNEHEQMFWQEVRCSFEHPAIVKILGWCVPAKPRRKTFFNSKKEKALRRKLYTRRYIVMEYLEGGSLDDQLFGDNGRDLEWRVRLNICKNAAGGISFLHKQGIIHCDIKPGNILLDENCSPKITDFGISLSFKASNSLIRGTLGYLDNEYAASGIASPKSDVYGFGVTLLNVLSGRRVQDFHRERGQTFLLDQVRELCIESRCRELIDPRMDSTVTDVNDFEEVLQIALRCCSSSSEERPTIDEVHSMLLKVGSERLREIDLVGDQK